jgi:hypothetical protein
VKSSDCVSTASLGEERQFAATLLVMSNSVATAATMRPPASRTVGADRDHRASRLRVAARLAVETDRPPAPDRRAPGGVRLVERAAEDLLGARVRHPGRWRLGDQDSGSCRTSALRRSRSPCVSW